MTGKEPIWTTLRVRTALLKLDTRLEVDIGSQPRSGCANYAGLGRSIELRRRLWAWIQSGSASAQRVRATTERGGRLATDAEFDAGREHAVQRA